MALHFGCSADAILQLLRGPEITSCVRIWKANGAAHTVTQSLAVVEVGESGELELLPS